MIGRDIDLTKDLIFTREKGGNHLTSFQKFPWNSRDEEPSSYRIEISNTSYTTSEWRNFTIEYDSGPDDENTTVNTYIYDNNMFYFDTTSRNSTSYSSTYYNIGHNNYDIVIDGYDIDDIYSYGQKIKILGKEKKKKYPWKSKPEKENHARIFYYALQPFVRSHELKSCKLPKERDHTIYSTDILFREMTFSKRLNRIINSIRDERNRRFRHNRAIPWLNNLSDRLYNDYLEDIRDESHDWLKYLASNWYRPQ